MVPLLLKQILSFNHQVDFGFRKRFDSQGKRILGGTIDGCVFLRNKRRNPMAQLLFTVMEWEKYSNINHSCPYNVSSLKHFAYDFRNKISLISAWSNFRWLQSERKLIKTFTTTVRTLRSLHDMVHLQCAPRNYKFNIAINKRLVKAPPSVLV